jgi:two-component system, NtrC family, response regulator
LVAEWIFVKDTRQKFPLVEIILLTAYANVGDGVQAMKNGAFDYILKGDDNDKVIPLLFKAIEKVQLQKRVQHLEQQIGKRYGFENILGGSLGGKRKRNSFRKELRLKNCLQYGRMRKRQDGY